MTKYTYNVLVDGEEVGAFVEFGAVRLDADVRAGYRAGTCESALRGEFVVAPGQAVLACYRVGAARAGQDVFLEVAAETGHVLHQAHVRCAPPAQKWGGLGRVAELEAIYAQRAAEEAADAARQSVPRGWDSV